MLQSSARSSYSVAPKLLPPVKLPAAGPGAREQTRDLGRLRDLSDVAGDELADQLVEAGGMELRAQPVALVSDNNFNDSQVTEFVAFAVRT
jgi:hypothetical protein